MNSVKTEDKVFIGYLQAIIAASILFIMVTYLGELFRHESSSPLLEQAIHILPSAAIGLPIAIIITFFLAAIPFWLMHKIADWRSLHGMGYYIISGGMAGLLTAAIALKVIPVPATVPELGSFWELLINMATRSIPSGALGGYVYWRKVRSFYTAQVDAV